MIHFNRGELARAQEVFEETLRLREAARGGAHTETLTTLSKLAQVLDARGDAEGAEKTFRETLRRAEDQYGANDRETIEWRDNLAVFLFRRRRYDEALPLTRRTVEQTEADAGPNARLTIVRMQRLGSIQIELGDKAAAATTLAEAASRAKRALRPEDPLQAEIEADLRLAR
jgi:tetratricopeptide (TPR) repeat protein